MVKQYDESRDIAKALAGDWGARMRIDVLIPWHVILRDLLKKKSEVGPAFTEDDLFLFLDQAVNTMASMMVLLNRSMLGAVESTVLTDDLVFTVMAAKLREQALLMAEASDV